MQNLSENVTVNESYLSGPFDECLVCEFLRNGCSGPRTNAMELPRWIVWIKAVMKRFGITNGDVADGTQLSKSTVDDIFAGRRKDISRETCCLIENYVLGTGKWPCAKKFSEGADVVYEDRPETLEALRRAAEDSSQKDALIEELKQSVKEGRDRHLEELRQIRADYEDDVKEYRELVAHMRMQVNRKDDYIDRLAKKVGI